MDEIQSWDDRRNYIVVNDPILFAAENWIHSAKRAIQQKGRFAVALSGGSTPKAIYEKLASLSADLDWSKVWLFWSDERCVAPDHPDSNYRMAMDAGLSKLPIPAPQIHRMHGEKDPHKAALEYDEKIRRILGKTAFDLIMLGVGEDGHTASLFPRTPALDIADQFAAANHVADKKSWRLTLTFPCINQSSHIAIYALGAAKQNIVPRVLEAAIVSPYPASRIGTPQNKALWILDADSSKFLSHEN